MGFACVATSASFSVCAAGTNGCVDAGSTHHDGGTCTARETSCTGGRDEDCDGHTDCADVDCASDAACHTCTPTSESTATTCTNGIDDDCDGVVDCADTSCTSAGVGACFGDFVDDHCTSITGTNWHGANTFTVSSLEVELTASGFRTVMRIPHTSATVELRSTARAGRTADLGAPPNEFNATCTDCVVLSAGGHTYFQRRGQVMYTQVPTAVGQMLVGSFSAFFDEVTLVGGEYQIVPGAGCEMESATFDGVAVSGGVAGSGSGSLVGSSVGQGQVGGGPTSSCGDGICDPGEDPSSCAADCPCGESAFTQRCAGGHLCPANADCVSRGRCSCGWINRLARGGVDRTPVDCSSDLLCTNGGDCTDSGWGCMYGASPAACGTFTNLSVPCGGGRCPYGSTCTAAALCDCSPGTATACDGRSCAVADCDTVPWYCGPP
jgi:hypothetical protein